MNRTNSLIILAAITLGTFFVFNTTTMINVSATQDKELSYYSPEPPSYQPMNNYYSEPPEYIPDRYGGYYYHYVGEFYLNQYV